MFLSDKSGSVRRKDSEDPSLRRRHSSMWQQIIHFTDRQTDTDGRRDVQRAVAIPHLTLLHSITR